mmetsp:Transcript_99612/g.214935  ORF Transcript_99612/g.214935 Transcript_99612/m.214935 type:complete len:1057 (-) Transcript_99612:2735-5905(-)
MRAPRGRPARGVEEHDPNDDGRAVRRAGELGSLDFALAFASICRRPACHSATAAQLAALAVDTQLDVLLTLRPLGPELRARAAAGLRPGEVPQAHHARGSLQPEILTLDAPAHLAGLGLVQRNAPREGALLVQELAAQALALEHDLEELGLLPAREPGDLHRCHLTAALEGDDVDPGHVQAEPGREVADESALRGLAAGRLAQPRDPEVELHGVHAPAEQLGVLQILPDLDRHGPMGAERADPPAAARADAAAHRGELRLEQLELDEGGSVILGEDFEVHGADLGSWHRGALEHHDTAGPGAEDRGHGLRKQVLQAPHVPGAPSGILGRVEADRRADPGRIESGVKVAVGLQQIHLRTAVEEEALEEMQALQLGVLQAVVRELVQAAPDLQEEAPVLSTPTCQAADLEVDPVRFQVVHQLHGAKANLVAAQRPPGQCKAVAGLRPQASHDEEQATEDAPRAGAGMLKQQAGAGNAPGHLVQVFVRQLRDAGRVGDDVARAAELRDSAAALAPEVPADGLHEPLADVALRRLVGVGDAPRPPDDIGVTAEHHLLVASLSRGGAVDHGGPDHLGVLQTLVALRVQVLLQGSGSRTARRLVHLQAAVQPEAPEELDVGARAAHGVAVQRAQAVAHVLEEGDRVAGQARVDLELHRVAGRPVPRLPRAARHARVPAVVVDVVVSCRCLAGLELAVPVVEPAGAVRQLAVARPQANARHGDAPLRDAHGLLQRLGEDVGQPRGPAPVDVAEEEGVALVLVEQVEVRAEAGRRRSWPEIGQEARGITRHLDLGAGLHRVVLEERELRPAPRGRHRVQGADALVDPLGLGRRGGGAEPHLEEDPVARLEPQTPVPRPRGRVPADERAGVQNRQLRHADAGGGVQRVVEQAGEVRAAGPLEAVRAVDDIYVRAEGRPPLQVVAVAAELPAAGCRGGVRVGRTDADEGGEAEVLEERQPQVRRVLVVEGPQKLLDLLELRAPLHEYLEADRVHLHRLLLGSGRQPLRHHMGDAEPQRRQAPLGSKLRDRLCQHAAAGLQRVHRQVPVRVGDVNVAAQRPLLEARV